MSHGSVKLLLCLLLPFVADAGAPSELIAAARAQMGETTLYDGAYVQLSYPGGDVSKDRGVCTDVIIRAMRGVGIDLQREVHEDMKRAFSAYPKLWDLRAPDRNIDHRRVPNLARLFERRGKKLPLGKDPGTFRPGDFVTCTVPPHLPHIMIVSDRKTPDGSRPLIIHNIGNGTREEDRLFEFELTGHFRWWPD